MTKSTVVMLILVLLGVPAAVAHGAPGGRSFETRVLQDWTGPAAGTEAGEHVGEYNGMHTGAPFGPAHDILAVDIREAYDGLGQPSLFLRFIFQGGNPSEGGELNDTVNFTLDGRKFGFFMATLDNEAWTSDFPTFRGPFPVGDGFPLALEGIVPYATLGVEPGAVLQDVAVYASYHDASMNGMRMAGDQAPGGFYYGHIPILPTDSPNDDSIQVDYTLAGPAKLLSLSLPGPMRLGETGEAATEIEIVSPIPDTSQQITLTVEVSPGFEAVLEQQEFLLDPVVGKQTTRLVVKAQEGFTGGRVLIKASSDLGLQAAADSTIESPIERGSNDSETGGLQQSASDSPTAPNPVATSVPTIPASSDSPEHAKEAPGFGLGPLGLFTLSLAILIRRRGRSI